MNSSKYGARFDEFKRNSVSLLTVFTALLRFDEHLVRTCYADLGEWFVVRAHHFNKVIVRGDEALFRQGDTQIQSACATDTYMNYAFARAIERFGVERSVVNVDSLMTTILINRLERVFKPSAFSLDVGADGGGGAKCRLSAQHATRVVLIPLHNAFHWSTLVLYRVAEGYASWMAVHYDTMGGHNAAMAKEVCTRLADVAAADFDADVDISLPVIQAQFVHQQRDQWSCGYRAACVANLVAREVSAYEIEPETTRSARREPIMVRVTNRLRDTRSADLDDEACARFLASELDLVRSREFCDCVRFRLENI